jgi:putative transposase
MEIYKTYKHNPPHLFRSNFKYFITGAIYQKRLLLKSDEAKKRLIHSLERGLNSKGWKLEEWVVLHNHYHAMAHSPANASSLSGIMRDIHKFTAMWIRKNIQDADGLEKIWWNYWDTCITYERSYYPRLNYLWYNPQKHGVIDRAEEWAFGSFYLRIREDAQYFRMLRGRYPFEDVKIRDDF